MDCRYMHEYSTIGIFVFSQSNACTNTFDHKFTWSIYLTTEVFITSLVNIIS